jgi:hydrogenase maturation factor
MKPRQTIILLAAVVALIAGIAVHQLVIAPRLEENKGEESLFFPDLDPEKATQISVQRGDTAVMLARDGDTAWRVETMAGHLADPDAVKSALELLKGLKQGNPSSQSKANHSRLGVDDKGLKVNVKAGETTVADLVVGNQGKNYGTNFARRADSDLVYLVYENLKTALDKKAGAWRDKSVFKEKLENISQVRLTTWPEAEGGTAKKADPETMIIRREKEAGDWVLVVSGDTVEKLDRSKTDAAVRNLVTLTASDFADDTSPAEAGLDPPQKKAEFTLKNGEALTLLVGEKDDSRFFVKRPDREVVQKVYQYNINNIFKDREELMPLPGETKEPEFDMGELLPAPRLETPDDKD